jgi:hypothetical protein
MQEQAYDATDQPFAHYTDIDQWKIPLQRDNQEVINI